MTVVESSNEHARALRDQARAIRLCASKLERMAASNPQLELPFWQNRVCRELRLMQVNLNALNARFSL